jgi:hypothetical protein
MSETEELIKLFENLCRKWGGELRGHDTCRVKIPGVKLRYETIGLHIPLRKIEARIFLPLTSEYELSRRAHDIARSKLEMYGVHYETPEKYDMGYDMYIWCPIENADKLFEALAAIGREWKVLYG